MNLKGTLPTLILRALTEGPNHGYRIAQEIKSKSKGVLDFREGTLYPALHALENKGLIESYEQVLKMFPVFFSAHYNLGLVLSEEGQYAQALEKFEQTLILNPNFTMAIYQIGKTYLKMGNKKAAKRRLEEYLSRAPEGEAAVDAKRALAKL